MNFLSKNKKTILISLSIFVLLLVSLYLFSGNNDSISAFSSVEGIIDNNIRPREKGQSPDFSFVDDNGNTKKLSDYRGKIVFLNFWASWCPPCIQEMPHMQSIHEKYQDDVKILAINLQEEQQTIKDFIEENGFTFSVISDKGPLGLHYGIRSIPTSFFIDREGVIQKIHTGYLTEEMMATIIESII